MTIYSDLIDMGYTDAEIREASSKRGGGPRTFTIAVSDTPDGDPIVGVTYQCDYRSEEETGIGSLYKALGGAGTHIWRMQRGANVLVTKFPGLHSLIVSTSPVKPFPEWGDDIEHANDNRWSTTLAAGSKTLYRGDTYDDHYTGTLPYAQGIDTSGRMLTYRSMKELRDYADTLGLTGPWPRKKADLITKIQSSTEYTTSAEEPNVWPGWFHYGDVLVLRADSGVVSAVLDLLYACSSRGDLAFGSGGISVFGSGFGLYSALDVGPKLAKARKEQNEWYDKQMKALEPVMKELKAKGHSWYFLGKPSPNAESGVKYWLNGATSPKTSKQPYGWYSLAELRAEKFVEDANART